MTSCARRLLSPKLVRSSICDWWRAVSLELIIMIKINFGRPQSRLGKTEGVTCVAARKKLSMLHYLVKIFLWQTWGKPFLADLLQKSQMVQSVISHFLDISPLWLLLERTTGKANRTEPVTVLGVTEKNYYPGKKKKKKKNGHLDYCIRRNFRAQFNFVYFVLLAERTKFCSIRIPCTYTRVCSPALAVWKFIAYESLRTLEYEIFTRMKISAITVCIKSEHCSYHAISRDWQGGVASRDRASLHRSAIKLDFRYPMRGTVSVLILCIIQVTVFFFFFFFFFARVVVLKIGRCRGEMREHKEIEPIFLLTFFFSGHLAEARLSYLAAVDSWERLFGSSYSHPSQRRVMSVYFSLCQELARRRGVRCVNNKTQVCKQLLAGGGGGGDGHGISTDARCLKDRSAKVRIALGFQEKF